MVLDTSVAGVHSVWPPHLYAQHIACALTEEQPRCTHACAVWPQWRVRVRCTLCPAPTKHNKNTTHPRRILCAIVYGNQHVDNSQIPRQRDTVFHIHTQGRARPAHGSCNKRRKRGQRHLSDGRLAFQYHIGRCGKIHRALVNGIS